MLLRQPKPVLLLVSQIGWRRIWRPFWALVKLSIWIMLQNDNEHSKYMSNTIWHRHCHVATSVQILRLQPKAHCWYRGWRYHVSLSSLTFSCSSCVNISSKMKFKWHCERYTQFRYRDNSIQLWWIGLISHEIKQNDFCYWPLQFCFCWLCHQWLIKNLF